MTAKGRGRPSASAASSTSAGNLKISMASGSPSPAGRVCCCQPEGLAGMPASNDISVAQKCCPTVITVCSYVSFMMGSVWPTYKLAFIQCQVDCQDDTADIWCSSGDMILFCADMHSTAQHHAKAWCHCCSMSSAQCTDLSGQDFVQMS